MHDTSTLYGDERAFVLDTLVRFKMTAINILTGSATFGDLRHARINACGGPFAGESRLITMITVRIQNKCPSGRPVSTLGHLSSWKNVLHHRTDAQW